jgi:hypothetical protein
METLLQRGIGIIERRGGELLVRDIDRLATMVQEATGE